VNCICYEQDALADEYHAWRGNWVSTLFAGDEEAKAVAKAKYISETLPKHMKIFEGMYNKFLVDGSVYAGDVSAPLQGGKQLVTFHHKHH
jgi:Glutathione S-transferase, C-terminal domain